MAGAAPLPRLSEWNSHPRGCSEPLWGNRSHIRSDLAPRSPPGALAGLCKIVEMGVGALATCSGPRLARTPSCHPGHGPAPPRDCGTPPPTTACVHREPAVSVATLRWLHRSEQPHDGHTSGPGRRPEGSAATRGREGAAFSRQTRGAQRSRACRPVRPPPPERTPPWGPNPALALPVWQPQVVISSQKPCLPLCVCSIRYPDLHPQLPHAHHNRFAWSRGKDRHRGHPGPGVLGVLPPPSCGPGSQH